MPAQNRKFDEFYGVQIVGTEVKNTICAWELWRDRKHVGYAYTQPALQDPNASTGWAFRELGDGNRSGTSYQARTWQQAVVEFRRALTAKGAPGEASWSTAVEENFVESTDMTENDIGGEVKETARLADSLGSSAIDSGRGK